MGESIHDPPPTDPEVPPPAQAVGDSNIFSDLPTIGPGAGLIGGLHQASPQQHATHPAGGRLPSWAAVVPPGTLAFCTLAFSLPRANGEPPAPTTTSAPIAVGEILGGGEATAAWSGWSPSATSEESEHDNAPEEDEPSGPLPPPLGKRAFPIGALTVALLEAVFLGIVLAFIRKQLIVPMVFHMVAGIALGWALGGVAKRGVGMGALVTLTACATGLMCASMFGFLFLWDRHPDLFRSFDADEFSRLFRPDLFERFQGYLSTQARELRLYGFNPGTTGAYILWVAEFVAAAVFAWFAVRSASRLSLTGSVPVEVLELVVGLRKQGRDPHAINTALIDGGWIDPHDQATARAAADAYLALLPARKRR
jgi:hypothetical protein